MPVFGFTGELKKAFPGRTSSEYLEVIRRSLNTADKNLKNKSKRSADKISSAAASSGN